MKIKTAALVAMVCLAITLLFSLSSGFLMGAGSYESFGLMSMIVSVLHFGSLINLAYAFYAAAK
ncbi:hypothetical protein GV829_10115 [Sphingomonas lacunae]|uniref:Uncharacterized protein n=1 Tax=Sphingomonas lacunae TaxID=2698828 RepID=A0A6M4AWQ2_9SPHN|nr:hypothetical protein [Sphingomonas lacunae]QJQ32752.1 hypothetical protein GV829_10115 [Sphingomonas lacunae]